MNKEQSTGNIGVSLLAGAERRKTVAHGASRGRSAKNLQSPGGAKE